MENNQDDNFNNSNSSHEIEKLRIEKQYYEFNNKNKFESKKQVVNAESISLNNQIVEDTVENSSEEQNNDNVLANDGDTNDFQEIMENESIKDDNRDNNVGVVKQLADREIKKAKAKIESSVLKFLIKNPIVLGIVIFIIVFLTIIITFMVMDIDFVGTGITSYSKAEVMQVNCNSIILIKEDERFTGPAVSSIEDVDIDETFTLPDRTTANRWEAKTYQLDDYVKGVVNAEASEVKDEKTYEVAAIVARTYALTITSSKCYIFSNENTRYSNPQQFEELDSSNENYSDISQAVSDTIGTVLTKDGNLYDHSNESYYDYFCYKERTYNGEGNYYKMLQENEEERLNIPLDWKEENVSSSLENVNCQKNGMSLFGAKYLLNNGVNAYDTLRVLKYYYGYDVVFKRVATISSFGASCGSFSMISTTLSKEEFVNLVNSYSSSKADFQTLKNHAAEIYDMSIANNFNPELVYARAEVEGYSPGGRTYNYYGINCTNNGGGNDCKSYSSVMDGVFAFMTIMQGYNVMTLFDVYNVKHYAYIGDKWYSNSGNWGKGGCIYLTSMQKYMSSDRYSAVKASCDAGTEIPTIAEDQEAYSYFQIEKMLEARQRIFNIGAEDCSSDAILSNGGALIGSNTCTLWAQGDSAWAKNTLGNSSKTMSSSGCLITSIAMAMTCSGAQITTPFNPGSFLAKLKEVGAFSGANYYWTKGNEATQSIAPGFIFSKKVSVSGASDAINKVNSNLNGRSMIVLKISNSKHAQHWVLYRSTDGNNFVVNDPAGGVINKYPASDVKEFAVFTY